ncbi:hypothetical protein [Oceanobacillus jordanicus]|uniref:Uncharacterized protein n=1 Tax=Oceanobacillus jordanicus TaxID=2867266 RepID=A0AAW5B9W6_9BACI|nr:hypothetical protein [Oceanobacillus jordanicus]MCG3421141.1 hypothetical protein [Oceanobacillus jordanicus]
MTRILRAHVVAAPGHARWLHVATQSGGFNGASSVGDKEIMPLQKGYVGVGRQGWF